MVTVPHLVQRTRDRFRAVLILTLFCLFSVSSAFAAQVTMLNPQASAKVYQGLTPSDYLVNGWAVNAETVSIFIDSDPVLATVPVADGVWEHSLDASTLTVGAHTIYASPSAADKSAAGSVSATVSVISSPLSLALLLNGRGHSGVFTNSALAPSMLRIAVSSSGNIGTIEWDGGGAVAHDPKYLNDNSAALSYSVTLANANGLNSVGASVATTDVTPIENDCARAIFCDTTAPDGADLAVDAVSDASYQGSNVVVLTGTADDAESGVRSVKVKVYNTGTGIPLPNLFPASVSYPTDDFGSATWEARIVLDKATAGNVDYHCKYLVTDMAGNASAELGNTAIISYDELTLDKPTITGTSVSLTDGIYYISGTVAFTAQCHNTPFLNTAGTWTAYVDGVEVITGTKSTTGTDPKDFVINGISASDYSEDFSHTLTFKTTDRAGNIVTSQPTIFNRSATSAGIILIITDITAGTGGIVVQETEGSSYYAKGPVNVVGTYVKNKLDTATVISLGKEFLVGTSSTVAPETSGGNPHPVTLTWTATAGTQETGSVWFAGTLIGGLSTISNSVTVHVPTNYNLTGLNIPTTDPTKTKIIDPNLFIKGTVTLNAQASQKYYFDFVPYNKLKVVIRRTSDFSLVREFPLSGSITSFVNSTMQMNISWNTTSGSVGVSDTPVGDTYSITIESVDTVGEFAGITCNVLSNVIVRNTTVAVGDPTVVAGSNVIFTGDDDFKVYGAITVQAAITAGTLDTIDASKSLKLKVPSAPDPTKDVPTSGTILYVDWNTDNGSYPDGNYDNIDMEFTDIWGTVRTSGGDGVDVKVDNSEVQVGISSITPTGAGLRYKKSSTEYYIQGTQDIQGSVLTPGDSDKVETSTLAIVETPNLADITKDGVNPYLYHWTPLPAPEPDKTVKIQLTGKYTGGTKSLKPSPEVTVHIDNAPPVVAISLPGYKQTFFYDPNVSPTLRLEGTILETNLKRWEMTLVYYENDGTPITRVISSDAPPPAGFSITPSVPGTVKVVWELPLDCLTDDMTRMNTVRLVATDMLDQTGNSDVLDPVTTIVGPVPFMFTTGLDPKYAPAVSLQVRGVTAWSATPGTSTYGPVYDAFQNGDEEAVFACIWGDPVAGSDFNYSLGMAASSGDPTYTRPNAFFMNPSNLTETEFITPDVATYPYNPVPVYAATDVEAIAGIRKYYEDFYAGFENFYTISIPWVEWNAATGLGTTGVEASYTNKYIPVDDDWTKISKLGAPLKLLAPVAETSRLYNVSVLGTKNSFGVNQASLEVLVDRVRPTFRILSPSKSMLVPVDASTHTVQMLDFRGMVSGGTFTLSIADEAGAVFTSGAIAYNASNATLDSAIEALMAAAGYTGVTAAVTGGPCPKDATVTFGGTASSFTIPVMTATPSLTGTGATLVVLSATPVTTPTSRLIIPPGGTLSLVFTINKQDVPDHDLRTPLKRISKDKQIPKVTLELYDSATGKPYLYNGLPVTYNLQNAVEKPNPYNGNGKALVTGNDTQQSGYTVSWNIPIDRRYAVGRYYKIRLSGMGDIVGNRAVYGTYNTLGALQKDLTKDGVDVFFKVSLSR
ncbi:MAG: hypothetical protein ACYC6A_00445 [Armatimonadota bacterium]